MSSALVRQALEFVDQEESCSKRGKRRAFPAPPARPARRGAAGQDHPHPYKHKAKKSQPVGVSQPQSTLEENIKRLLALSSQTADRSVAEKIVERAIRGKPLLEKIEEKKEDGKSILFPEEEPYSKFEREHFCS